MIVGTGIDIVEIKRMQKALDRWGDDFLKHIFTDEEIAYAKNKKFPTQHYAARFAAKEAVYKAFGDDRTLGWKSVTILNDEHGRPYCQMNDRKVTGRILISMSHSKKYAIASAIITT